MVREQASPHILLHLIRSKSPGCLFFPFLFLFFFFQFLSMQSAAHYATPHPLIDGFTPIRREELRNGLYG